MPVFKIPDIDPELALPLGQIVIHWATLESLISLLLGTFLSADQGGMFVVTNSVPVSAQSKWVRALMACHEHEQQQNENVAKLLDRADELRNERNEFVHGHWDTTGCEAKTALIQTVNLDRTEIIRERLVTPKDLADFLADIDDWINDYVILGRKLGFPRHRGDAKSIFAD